MDRRNQNAVMDRRRCVRRRGDMYLGIDKIQVCPNTLEVIRSSIERAIVPVRGVLLDLADEKKITIDNLKMAKRGLDLIESLRDSFEPCYAVAVVCPKIHHSPWRSFLIWIVTKIS